MEPRRGVRQGRPRRSSAPDGAKPHFVRDAGEMSSRAKLAVRRAKSRDLAGVTAARIGLPPKALVMGATGAVASALPPVPTRSLDCVPQRVTPLGMTTPGGGSVGKAQPSLREIVCRATRPPRSCRSSAVPVAERPRRRRPPSPQGFGTLFAPRLLAKAGKEKAVWAMRHNGIPGLPARPCDRRATRRLTAAQASFSFAASRVYGAKTRARAPRGRRTAPTVRGPGPHSRGRGRVWLCGRVHPLPPASGGRPLPARERWSAAARCRAAAAPRVDGGTGSLSSCVGACEPRARTGRGQGEPGWPARG